MHISGASGADGDMLAWASGIWFGLRMVLIGSGYWRCRVRSCMWKRGDHAIWNLGVDNGHSVVYMESSQSYEVEKLTLR